METLPPTSFLPPRPRHSSSSSDNKGIVASQGRYTTPAHIFSLLTVTGFGYPPPFKRNPKKEGLTVSEILWSTLKPPHFFFFPFRELSSSPGKCGVEGGGKRWFITKVRTRDRSIRSEGGTNSTCWQPHRPLFLVAHSSSGSSFTASSLSEEREHTIKGKRRMYYVLRFSFWEDS